ncbi:MAG: DNA polymerase III subunit delta [Thalassotalea sp.]
MRIYHNQLNNTLQQQVLPVWLVFGDEPWQKIDSLNQIKHHAQQQGFSETVRLTADDKFDWYNLVDEFQSMSLFASQRIIELEIPNAKVGVEGSKVLQQISTLLIPDILLIIHGAKVDAATTKKKWFTVLEKQGGYLPLYDIDGNHLHRWIQQQAKQLKLNLHPDVPSLLAGLFEGNLPALAQELEKFTLLFGDQLIHLDDIEPLTIKQAKFNPFQLTEALLSGQLDKCISMLDSLQHEGTSATQIIWVLHKELQQLSQMKQQLNSGQNIAELFKQYRIWDKRKPVYQQALTTLTIENIDTALARIADTDLISKTSSDFNPFILLADVCLSLYRGDITNNLPLDYEFA